MNVHQGGEAFAVAGRSGLYNFPLHRDRQTAIDQTIKFQLNRVARCETAIQTERDVAVSEVFGGGDSVDLIALPIGHFALEAGLQGLADKPRL